MKFQKLLCSAAIVCVSFGTSGAALAADCGSGVILRRIVNRVTVPVGQDCTIYESVVEKGITATGSSIINIVDSRIIGDVTVTKPTECSKRCLSKHVQPSAIQMRAM